MIGNVGLKSDCGNSDLIEEAIKELEKLGYEIEHGVVKLAKKIDKDLKKAGHAISNFFHHFF